MGGHHSSQTMSATTDLVTNASLDIAQGCLSYASGSQTMSIQGSGNVFEGNVQKANIVVKTDCFDRATQDGKFKLHLTDSISQSLKDQEQGLTEWLDPSGDDQTSSITESVTTNITLENVQNCVTNLNGSQVFVVPGDHNIVIDNMQDQSMTMASHCLMKNGQTTKAVYDVTNIFNQHSDFKEKSPFAFITDAIEALAKSALAIAAVVFIAIVILVLVFEARHFLHKHQSSSTSVPEPTTQTATA